MTPPLLPSQVCGAAPLLSRRVPREGEALSPRSKRPDYKIDPQTGCWNWLKFKTHMGYPGGHAHRHYYAAAHGLTYEDLKGIEIHHVCRNPSCVNPGHLEALTPRAHDIETYLKGWAGISLEDVRAIRELGRQPGVRAPAVAEQYGIHEITVYNYWNNTAWADFFDDGPCRPHGRKCAVCAGEIAPEKARSAVYCSRVCQRRRHSKKWRAAA